MDLAFTSQEAAFAAEVRAWLAANLELPAPFASPEKELDWGRAWQARMAADRWVGIWWPAEYGGRDATPVEVALFNMEYARAGAPQPVNRVGINLAGPTLLAHGTEAQKRRWLPAILDASEIWCQLFSEPDAGSDLAALSTRAEPVDGGWLLTGQKVWTSYAQFARWGICLARTDPGAPRHRGISYLVVDMTAEGIDIRPLRQITGETEFNEVFLDRVFVPQEQLVGTLNAGWAVANTTLAHERGTNFPFKEQVVHEVYLDRLYRQAAADGRLDSVEVADALAQVFVELRVLRLHNWRTLSRLGRGIEPGAESSWIKLAWSDMTQHLSQTALDVVGDASPLEGEWSRQWLWSKAASIAGGTSEIQRTIIAERLLGLPRS
ncbi:acyl-CoA dehydrogenase family protein [Rhabdothermincola sediminis]|uniref:acyl-CoA dehydrogenase family protein n=1 Tax=Rhabdothermincola sediminis TaxID=2751370 RepID=UPI001AA0354A|nr:acyl-CoA dehydrogenase family protein [Rhabdothermincola sediminis]